MGTPLQVVLAEIQQGIGFLFLITANAGNVEVVEPSLLGFLLCQAGGVVSLFIVDVVSHEGPKIAQEVEQRLVSVLHGSLSTML